MKCGMRIAGPVAATVPLHVRSRIGRKALTELLVSKRPQTAVAIGRHHLKRESQREMRIADCGVRNDYSPPIFRIPKFRLPQSAFPSAFLAIQV